MTNVLCPGEKLAVIPMTRQLDFKSALNGRNYRIQIAMPLAPPPKTGYPVLYVTDGDVNFAGLSATVRMRGYIREIEPAAVVGIGYPESEGNLLACLQHRNLDLTPTAADAATKESVSKQMGGLSVDSFGGADLFLDVIEKEIKPRVSQFVAVAPKREILFGHSLGGLFVVHALFARPSAFEAYLALSPSLWWDRLSVLRSVSAFVKRVNDHEVAPSVFIGVGEYEQMPARVPQLPPEEVVAAAMVDNAMSLGKQLSSANGRAEYRVVTKIFEGQSHLAVVSTATNTLLDFALGRAPKC